jgi:thioredoxin-like negative regulator of GroEL
MQQTFIPRDHFRALRDADVFAVDGELREANDIYIGLVNREGVAREVMIEAAIGLYRTGAFRAAAEAFQKLAPFRRGEEDVRFYFAVVLYETGVFEAAHHELSCALLFIQVTDDVARYRQKIELMAQRQASR